MISVVKYFGEIFFKKNIFFENIFRRLVCMKKLRKTKIKVRIWPDSGEQVWPDQWPDLVRSSRIHAILARSGQIPAGIWSIDSGDSDRMSSDTGAYRFPVPE